MEAGSSRGLGTLAGGAGASGAVDKGPKSAGGASDFVKKLYKMLDEPAFHHIVSWGRTGDSFVVKDMNDFTKLILPRHFKHSNFASFVRQLNKYDFHKVKNPEDGQTGYGEHTWEFRHPQFRADTQDSLDNIKRKAPAPKRSQTGLNQAVNGPGGYGTGPAGSAGGQGALVSANGAGGPPSGEGLQGQIDAMHQVQQAMNHQIYSLTREYQAMVNEMVNFRRNFVAHDQIMQNLIHYAVGLESDRRPDHAPPFVPSEQAQRLIASYQEVTRASLEQMDEIARRGLLQGPGSGGGGGGGSGQPAPPYPGPPPRHGSFPDGLAAPQHQHQGGSNSSSPPSGGGYDSPPYHYPSAHQDDMSSYPHRPPAPGGPAVSTGQATAHQPATFPGEAPGLRVFTVGHFMPREEAEAAAAAAGVRQQPATFPTQPNRQMPTLDQTTRRTTSDGSRHPPSPPPSSAAAGAKPATPPLERTDRPAGSSPPGQQQQQQQQQEQQQPAPPTNGGKPMLRVRRGTYIPGWAVPPRVLLVEDDAVCRTLSSKFLQVFGCAIDVAVDGVTAVNKMNLEKFDLCLMDIVLPQMNGIDATSIIRQFDSTTPIISMTSNARPDDILTYFDHGMNDILPKPFTKDGLLTMLEKHLTHMKTMHQLGAEVPRSLGVPAGGDPKLQSLVSAAVAGSTAAGANPFADMGISDESYRAMMTGFIEGAEGGGGNKRSLEDDGSGEAKRGRFEEIAS